MGRAGDTLEALIIMMLMKANKIASDLVSPEILLLTKVFITVGIADSNEVVRHSTEDSLDELNLAESGANCIRTRLVITLSLPESNHVITDGPPLISSLCHCLQSPFRWMKVPAPPVAWRWRRYAPAGSGSGCGI